jgi:hypothetical protein
MGSKMITKQDTYETLKHGYIKPTTLILELEDLIPDITRNFNIFYSNQVKQELYDRGKRDKLGEVDGFSYTKEIRYSLQDNKNYYKIGYEFTFVLEDSNKKNCSIIMKTSPTYEIGHITYENEKQIIITSKQHFFDLIVEWQNFIQSETDKIILHLHHIANDPNIGNELRKVYNLPRTDMDIHEILAYNSCCWKHDIDSYIEKLNDSIDTLKSFG